MRRTTELPPVIGPLLDDPVGEERVGRLWAGTEARGRASKRPRVRVALAIATVTLGAIAAVFLLPSEEPPFLALADGSAPVAVRAAASESIRFADESTIELSAGSRLVPVRNDLTTFETLLEQGRAVFDVVPHGSRRWIVRAGSATVSVLGTSFVVEVEPDRTTVAVERGVVRVDGAILEGGYRVLRAGERIELVEEPPVATLAEPERERDERRVALLAEPAAEPLVADARPAPEEPPALESAETLMQDADRARAEGRFADAAVSLERLVADHPEHRSAVLAAIILGRIEMDQLGRPYRARRAFERAISLGVPAALRDDVERRLVTLEAAP
jgi:hypothetical protein